MFYICSIELINTTVMTAKDLNKEIKQLFKLFNIHIQLDSSTVFFDWVERYARKEFLRLYDSDKELYYMNKNSIIMILQMNRTMQIVPPHHFLILAKLK